MTISPNDQDVDGSIRSISCAQRAPTSLRPRTRILTTTSGPALINRPPAMTRAAGLRPAPSRTSAPLTPVSTACPRCAIPTGSVTRGHPACCSELTTYRHVSFAIYGQCMDASVDSAAHGMPRTAIPAGDVACYSPTGSGEFSARVERAIGSNCQCTYRVVHSSTHRMPSCAIPAGYPISRPPAGGGELSPRVNGAVGLLPARKRSFNPLPIGCQARPSHRAIVNSPPA